MKDLNLILLSGKARSGKTTFANSLIPDTGPEYASLSLAGPIKADLLILNPIIDSGGRRLQEVLLMLPEDEVKDRYPEYRRLMQTYGTEVRRAEDDDVWINKAIKALQHWVDTESHEQPINVVIPDVRTIHEGETLIHYAYRKLNYPLGLRVNVSWIGIERIKAGEAGELAKHSSESGVGEVLSDPRVVVVHNDSTLEALEDTAKMVANIQCQAQSAR